jgi:hypothetical protein
VNSLSTANRASAAITGIALLLVVSVTLASVVAVGSDQLQVIPSSYACQDTTASTGGRTDNSVSSSLPAHQASNVALSLTVSETMIALTHEAGPSLRLAMVDMHISVNQEPLLHQPPIPFFAAKGFRSGPYGPFNSASDGIWSVGEQGAIRIAGTNSPQPLPGRFIDITIRYRGCVIGEIGATIRR